MPAPQKAITICLFSDTHQLHRELEMPRASLYICAGDFTMFSRSMDSVRDFNEWLGELGAPVVLIPGNHESFLELDPSKRSLLSNATVLINESVDIAALKIWGSPVVPLGGTAFGMPSAADRRRLYSTIPEDMDILITHGPPFGVLDIAPGSRYLSGCPELLEAVQSPADAPCVWACPRRVRHAGDRRYALRERGLALSGRRHRAEADRC